MIMHALILGALSHLGTNFILSHGHKYKITALDRDSYCSQSKDLINPHVDKLIICDITNANIVSIVVWNEIDVIFNFAASTHVDRSYMKPNEFIHDNITAVEHIMNSLVELKKMHCMPYTIHLSTDEVYGDDYATPRSESDRMNPTNVYSATKSSGDMIINSYIKSFGVNCLVLRPNNLAGLYQYPDKILPLFIKKIMSNDTIQVHGTGMQTRCFVSTEFVCDIINHLALVKPESQFLNIGYNCQVGLSVLDIIELISAMTKKTANVVYTEDRPYNDTHYSIDNSRLASVIQDEKILMGLNETSVDAVKQMIDHTLFSQRTYLSRPGQLPPV
jgi:dTDP-glucose 4,6-dehydratase